jgi:hypothetical protein
MTLHDPDDNEADFLEDGSNPTSNNSDDGVEFVTEEELAERDKDIARKQ